MPFRKRRNRVLKIAKPSDKGKIEELKKKINNSEYLSEAINKIAQKLTEDLVDKD
jgi:anti-sigma28 factor (negative regulator of flagellin synthesis)